MHLGSRSLGLENKRGIKKIITLGQPLQLGIWKNYLRWRHSKGFGVHSPYAYRFVIDVLRPGPYIFYSYEEIDRLLKGNEFSNHTLIRLIRFAIRLVVFLKAERIVSPPGCRWAVVTAGALNLEYKKIQTKSTFKLRKGDLLFAEGSSCEISTAKEALDKGIPVFAVNPHPRLRDLLEEPIAHGLLMKGRNRLILIPRNEMEYTSYDITLK